MTEPEKNMLFSCGLFAGIDRAEGERLLECLVSEETRYEKNEIIWQIGEQVDACAVVLSGAVRAEAVNAAGEHSLMARHGPGALVGDILMATPGGASPVYVIAAKPVKVVFLPYRRIMGACERCCSAHGKLRENLLAEIAAKYWAQRRRIGYLSAGSLRTRIAMYLLDQGSGTFSLNCTREDLADFLCVNRSALSRELGRMKQENLIDFYRDTFRITDREKLAGFVP